MRPPSEDVIAPEPVAAVDATESGLADTTPPPSAAPSRPVAREAVLEELAATGDRVSADADAPVATAAGKAVAQTAERERRMPGAAADAAPTDDGADAAIDAIVSAWEAGDTAEAERLLEAFAEAYPDYPETGLRDALPEALLEDRTPQ
jgi:hypothetical protein